MNIMDKLYKRVEERGVRLYYNPFDIIDYNEWISKFEKIEKYSLEHKQVIPHVEVEDYPKILWTSEQAKEFPILASMYNSNDKIERYWVNKCVNKLEKMGLKNKQYLDRLEYEADIKKTISEKLETNMFRYPNTLQKAPYNPLSSGSLFEASSVEIRIHHS